MGMGFDGFGRMGISMRFILIRSLLLALALLIATTTAGAATLNVVGGDLVGASNVEVDGNLPRGFSGGPLISHSGKLIGINTSVPRGSGMTVPVGNIRRSIEGIGKEGNARIGYFGVNTAGAKLDGGEAGLVVTSVDPDSPAALSRVATGDVILVMDGEPMVSQAALYHVLLDGPRSVTLEISRGNARKEIQVTLSERSGE
jgi:serine protease Do